MLDQDDGHDDAADAADAADGGRHTARGRVSAAADGEPSGKGAVGKPKIRAGQAIEREFGKVSPLSTHSGLTICTILILFGPRSSQVRIVGEVFRRAQEAKRAAHCRPGVSSDGSP